MIHARRLFAMADMSATYFLSNNEGFSAHFYRYYQGLAQEKIMSKLYQTKQHLVCAACSVYKNMYPHWYFLRICSQERSCNECKTCAPDNVGEHGHM